LRFAELRKKLDGITEEVMTDQLRQLEEDRVVHRTVTVSVPPQVSYSLSARGETLVPMME
jgi:DNA-binding HxlR family transcriptional regulator